MNRLEDKILEDVYLYMIALYYTSYNEVYSKFITKYPDSSDHISTAYRLLTRAPLNGSSDENQKHHPIRNVPTILSLPKKQTSDDIYIISLRLFNENWKTGLSYKMYLHNIRNVYGIEIDDTNLLRIYNEITNTRVEHHNHDSWATPNYATTESIFRLLEYVELQESFKQSISARWWAIAAMGVSIISLIVSVGFSIWQINLTKEQMATDPKIDTVQFNEIKTLAKKDHEKLDKIANLLSDTLNVKVKPSIKRKK